METITIVRQQDADEDGHVLGAEDAFNVAGLVYPSGESKALDVDVDGDMSSLDVLIPSGFDVAVDDLVVIRGVYYRVVFAPFDWSVGRRAWNTRHRPGVKIRVERGEG